MARGPNIPAFPLGWERLASSSGSGVVRSVSLCPPARALHYPGEIELGARLRSGLDDLAQTSRPGCSRSSSRRAPPAHRMRRRRCDGLVSVWCGVPGWPRNGLPRSHTPLPPRAYPPTFEQLFDPLNPSSEGTLTGSGRGSRMAPDGPSTGAAGWPADTGSRTPIRWPAPIRCGRSRARPVGGRNPRPRYPVPVHPPRAP